MARNTMESWLREEQGSDVIRRLDEGSVAEAAFRGIPMSGTTKTEPRTAGMSVGVVSKGGTYSEDTGANDEVTLTARKFGSALRLAEEDIDDEIADVLAAKKASWTTTFSMLLDHAVLGVTATENGTTIPFTSVYKALGTTNAATGYTAGDNKLETLGALAYEDLSDLASLVEGSGFSSGTGDVFIAHPSVKGTLRKIKDGNGQYIFTQAPRAGDPDTLFGYPLKWSNGSVTAATAKADQAVASPTGTVGVAGNALLFFGNPAFALLGKRSSVESVVIDGRDGLSALTDETILKVRARRAFTLAHEKAWATLEITNVTP